MEEPGCLRWKGKVEREKPISAPLKSFCVHREEEGMHIYYRERGGERSRSNLKQNEGMSLCQDA